MDRQSSGLNRFTDRLTKRIDSRLTKSPSTSTSLSSIPKKQSIRQRLKQSLGLGKTKDSSQHKVLSQAPVALHLTHDYQPQDNPTHQKLPEEHRTSWQRTKDEVELLREQKTRTFKGPVPKRLPSDGPDSLAELRRDLNAALLTPIEADVWFNLSKTGRAAYFKPIQVHRPDPTAPINEYILVHASDVGHLQRIQDITRRMPEEEKHRLLKTMHAQVSAAHIYTLRQVLFRPALRITASVMGTGVESQTFAGPQMRRPSSLELIQVGRTGVRDSWMARHSTRDAPRGGRGFQKRPFMVGENEADQLQDSPSSLRGGGGDDDDGEGLRRVKWNRGERLFLGVLGCTLQEKPLANGERVPKALWWLAGGPTRRGKKAPTVGELRQRGGFEVKRIKESRSPEQEMSEAIGSFPSAAGAKPDQAEDATNPENERNGPEV